MMIAAIKLLLFFALPVTVLQIPSIGDLYAFSFLEFYQLSNPYILVPLFLYIIMLMFCISPFQHYSLFFFFFFLLVETLFITNITILLPIDSMRAALNSIVMKVNDPLVNLTLLEEYIDRFLAGHISNYMVYSTLIKKAIQVLIDAFPQYFQVVQYTVEIVTKSISELFEILVKLLNILFRPGLSTIINPCLTFVYGACMFLKPASRGPQTA